MLPTEKAEGYCILSDKSDRKSLSYHGDRFFTQEYLNETARVSNHLHLISDETPKLNDHVSSPIFEGLVYQVNKDNLEATLHNKCKKIIATTDKAIFNYMGQDGEDAIVKQMPQIPESFIKAYVEARGDIKEVQVEYGQFGTIYYIKTRADNTIIISKNKMVTVAQMRQFKRDTELGSNTLFAQKWKRLLTCEEMEDKWIEEHL